MTNINDKINTFNSLIEFNADAPTILGFIFSNIPNSMNYKEKIISDYSIMIYNILELYISFKKFISIEKNITLEKINNFFNNSGMNIDEQTRVIFILLAEQHAFLSDNSKQNEDKIKCARECKNIYIELAREFKLNAIKSKIVDLCFFYLHRDSYNSIINSINGDYKEFNSYLSQIKDDISELLAKEKIYFTINSRVKTIYSIYEKINRGKTINTIYDILAIRIVVNNVDDCYNVLDKLLNSFEQIPGRFKDYILNPKDNNYQSLHITLKDSNNRIFEVQIRTKKMDINAKTGTANHEKYKIHERIIK